MWPPASTGGTCRTRAVGSKRRIPERGDPVNTTSYLQLHVHLVWATWNRLRLITPPIEAVLRPSLLAKASELGCTTLALGGIDDHVHHLLAVPATLPLARIAQELKGGSAHFINAQTGERTFRWQAGYGAFTLSRDDLERVTEYIRRQREHHEAHRLWWDLERVHPDALPSQTGSTRGS